jgi:hypothetical protein
MMALKVLGFGILVAVSSFFLSEMGFKGKRIYGALGICLLLLYFLSSFGDALSVITSYDVGEGTGEAIRCALKIIGIAEAFSLAAEVATELSERGVASALGLIGKLEIFLISLPYVEKMISLARDIFGNI